MMKAALFGLLLWTAAPISAASAQQPAESADARQLYAILLTPGPAWKPGKPFQEQGLGPHLNYWVGLFRAGRIATAGPLGSDSGLVLVLAKDQADAEAVMRGDPAVGSAIFKGEVQRYAPPMIKPEVLGKAAERK